MGQDVVVPERSAELSSIADQLVQLTARVTAMAEAAETAHESDVAVELFGVERALAGAARRVERLAEPRPRRR